MLACLLLALALGWAFIGYASSASFADSSYVGVVNIDGPINPLSARYLVRGIDKATDDRAQMVLIRLDTPGGLLSSTRDMVGAMLGAKIPVIVYVSPPGAQAASAGTFITAAANFAAMAPGTNIGAASPVAAGGQDIPTTLAKKINEDTRAFIRSIAEQRDRNIQALEETVTHARSYSAREATERNVVDLIASDLAVLLVQLDGRTTSTSAGTVTLRTQGSSVREIKMTLLEGFLNFVTNPNIIFVLLAIGGLGILVEMLTPGFLGPGVVGIIALSLAYMAMGNLPVNWVGVGLILFSMILLYLELLQPGLGIYGLGGVICFVLGGFLLFGDRSLDIPEPSFRVSLWAIGVMTAMVVVPMLFFVYAASTTGGSKTGYTSGKEDALIGQRGIAVSVLAPSGKVRIANQEWTATTDPGELIQEGEEVNVIGVYGNIVKVSRYYQEDSDVNH